MSTEKKFNLASLRQAMQDTCETKDVDHYLQALYGPTDEQLDAEHEQEFRLLTEQIDLEKKLGLLEFLSELANPNHHIEAWDDQLTCISDDLYRLYLAWCDLDKKPMLTEQLFFHGLYLFGFVSRDCFIGIEMTDGIGIDLTTSEVRLNLKANPHAEL